MTKKTYRAGALSVPVIVAVVPFAARLCVGLELVRSLATAAALPMLPLLLFKYPLAELVKQFFVRLTGM